MCSKGKFLWGQCWKQDALRAQTLCWTHMDALADGLLLLSLLLQATLYASDLSAPPPKKKAMNDLFVFAFEVKSYCI